MNSFKTIGITLIVLLSLQSCVDATSDRLPLIFSLPPQPIVEKNQTIIKWQSSTEATAIIHYGTDRNNLSEIKEMETAAIDGEVSLKNLEASQAYYYTVTLIADKKTTMSSKLAFLASSANAYDGGISIAKTSTSGEHTVEGFIIENGIANYRNVFIQDEVTGIQLRLDDAITARPEIKLGQKIRVRGSISYYRKMPQLNVKLEDILIVDDAIEIKPLEIPASLFEAVHGRLVTVVGFDGIKGGIVFEGEEQTTISTWDANQNYILTSGIDEILVRINGFTDIPGTTVRSFPMNITGVVYNFEDDKQLLPRFQTDFN